VRKALPLRGKVALVTGGAKRVGRAVVEALAGAGAAVAIHARESESEARALATALRKKGRRAAVLSGDLADPGTPRRLVEATVEALGRLDVVVNNAAIFRATDPLAPDATAWDDHMAVNARAVYLLTGEAGAWMARHGGGCVVNVACASATSPWPKYLPYSASKAAVVAVTRGYAKALGPRVRVNAVAPGPILPAAGSPRSRQKAAVEATVLRRWGDPRDVAEAILNLATAPFVTGAVLPVDGGRHLKP
jgi:NAD(P)-dependent dehydrogenase (short-subunit alcohol dehydrogenase family)